MRRLAVSVLASVAAIVLPAAAAAHVQISPTLAAPGDPTLFTLLVPNESDVATVQVDVKIPAGVIPFSFEEIPGWRREEQRTDSGALDVVTWKGSLPAGAFVRFSFLARTPDESGEIAWPAVQRYADGSVVRWIGAVGSEEPAAVTTISADAPRQNAGGEGAESPSTGPADATEPEPPASETTAAAPATSEPVDDASAAGATGASGSDGLARGFGIAGIAVAVIALAASLARRRRAS
jgi:uncharacterized protein YcnI